MKATWFTKEQSGVHVHIFPTTKYKMVTVLASWQIPLRKETVTGYAILPHVMLRGTDLHPSPEGLMRAFDDLYGASISGRAVKQGDAQTIEFTLQCASEKHLPEAAGLFYDAFSLFAQVLYTPHLEAGSFSKKAVQTEKELHRQRIENAMNDKISYASDRCVQVMFDGLAYGIPRSGYVEDVEFITEQNLYDRYQELVKSSELHVYLVGDVDAAVTADQVLAALLEQRSKVAQDAVKELVGTVRTFPFDQEPGKTDPRLVVERMDVSQGKLNLGLVTGSSYASDDYPALLVYNGILGGFPHSKLFTNVREKASLAYYASSRLEGLKGVIFISSGIQIENFERARLIIEEQLSKLRAGEISEDELNFTKDGLVNQYLLSDDQPMTGAMLQMYGRLSGRERTVEELLASIAAVTREEVIQIAQGVQLDTVYFLRDKEELAHA